MSAAPVTATRRLEMSRPVAVGMVEQRLVDRRRPGEHRDPLALDELEHDARVEHGDREDGRARASATARQPALYPKMWKNGLTIR